MKFKWLSIVLLSLVVWGCATIKPGNDPLVVRAEQTLTGGKATFDMVLRFDNQDRGFWRTNAPAFHQFCEWLRVPVPTAADPGIVLPRASTILYNLDQDKQKYAQLGGSTNALWASLQTALSALNQAGSWAGVVTNSTH